MVYARSWWALVTGMSESFIYFAGVGYGVGSLVGGMSFEGRPLSYAAFVTPALTASAALNGAVVDSTFNLFFKLRYSRVYEAAMATPVEPSTIVVGEVLWALLRGVVYAGVFLAGAAALGLVTSPWALLALPAALLIALAFAAAGCAAVTWLRTIHDFDLVQLVLLPLYLFSGTFVPTNAYPEPVRIVAEATPLTRAVDLLRSLTVGVLDPRLALDVLYLLVLACAGFAISRRRFAKLLTV